MAAPDHVAAGELIESAWGNSVVDELGAVRAVMHINGTLVYGHPMIQGTALLVTTDAAGKFSYTYPLAFAANPVVTCHVAMDTVPWVAVPVSGNLSGFTGQVRNETGAVVASQSGIAIMYTAVGVWGT